MIMATIPLTRRIIAYIAKSFFEDSHYKEDLHQEIKNLDTHEDLAHIYFELKNISTMLYAVLSEYKNCIQLYRTSGDTNLPKRRL